MGEEEKEKEKMLSSDQADGCVKSWHGAIDTHAAVHLWWRFSLGSVSNIDE